MSPGVKKSDEQVQSLQTPESERTIASDQKVTIKTLRKIFISKRELQRQIDQKIEELQAAESEESQTLIRKRLQKLKVEFKEAGASSLDLTIIAEFSGQVVKHYYVLSRAIQRIAVDACNQNDWVIPFIQLTIHAAEALQKLEHLE